MPKKSKEDQELERELRYLSPENIAKDFHTKKERAAIEATLIWLDMNAVIGWRFKGNGRKKSQVTTNVCSSSRTGTNLDDYDAVVMDRSTLEHAQRVLLGEEKK